MNPRPQKYTLTTTIFPYSTLCQLRNPPTPSACGLQQLLVNRGVADRLLQLLERPHLDLPDPFPADVVFLAPVLERGRVVAQPALGEDVALAVVQHPHRVVPQPAPLRQLLVLAEPCLLVPVQTGRATGRESE